MKVKKLIKTLETILERRNYIDLDLSELDELKPEIDTVLLYTGMRRFERLPEAKRKQIVDILNSADD